jgi:hypothetical protein
VVGKLTNELSITREARTHVVSHSGGRAGPPPRRSSWWSKIQIQITLKVSLSAT